MAQFASASFTGTNGTVLSTADSNWTRHTSYSVNTVIDSNRAAGDSGGTSAYYHSGTPASADYTVSADIYFRADDSSTPFAGVLGRVSTSANTFYMARYTGGAIDGWQLYRFVGGTPTQLGSTVGETFPAGGTSWNILLRMVGSDISLYKQGGGTPTISVTDGSPITAAGKSGLRINPVTGSYGLLLDNFSADDIGVTYTLYSPTMVYSAGSWYPQVGETVA